MGEIEKNNLNQLEAEITILKHQTAQNIIEIGKRLIKAKEMLPHGEWGNWLREKVDFSWDVANKFMRIAREYSNSLPTQNLGFEKLFILTSVEEEERGTFIEENPVEDMTTRELRQAIKEKKDLEKQIEELKNQEPQTIEKEKVVEKEVYPDDYEYFKNSTKRLQQQVAELNNKSQDYKYDLEKLEREKNILERKAKLNEEDSKKYNELKRQIDFLYKEKDNLSRQIQSATELSELAVRIDDLLKNELAPVRYSRVFERMDSPVARDNLLSILDKVSQWCFDIRNMIPEEYRKVEVIEYENY